MSDTASNYPFHFKSQFPVSLSHFPHNPIQKNLPSLKTIYNFLNYRSWRICMTEKNESLEYQQALKQYYWKCFLSEFSKILIFLLIAIFLGLIKEYLVALFSMMFLRSIGGGLHYKHYISCLFVSFCFLFGSIVLAILFQPPFIPVILSLFLCAITGYLLVPITSENRPPATEKQIISCKRRTFFLIFVFSILACICPFSRLFFIGYWTIILHIIQLCMAHFIKEVKKHV